MQRIYLAKSNTSNPNLVAKVRTILSKYNVEIVEYCGGTYSHDLLLSCDELIVIPDLSKSWSEEYCSEFLIPIGKGLYDQLNVFSFKRENIFIVTNFDDKEDIGGLCYDSFSKKYYKIEIFDESDYKEYAHITINTNEAEIAPWELKNYMSEAHELKNESEITKCLSDSIIGNKNVSKYEKFKYLLIKNLYN